MGPAQLSFSPAAERWASSAAAAEFDVLHQHGVWPLFSRVTSAGRRAQRRPTIIAPHGCFETWPMRRSRWKKWLAAHAYERANLHAATCLQATAEAEIRGIRAFGLTNPVAVLPNGISDEWLGLQGNDADFRLAYDVPPGRRILLFLSRLHPKKGAIELVHAFAAVHEQHPEWHLVIAGPEESRTYAMRLRRTISRYRLNHKIQLVGPLQIKEKRNALAAADILVLPTISENFAIVIAEALACGVPVLTTRGAIAWPSLEEQQCGWRTDVGLRPFTDGLRVAMNTTPDVLAEMGERGRQLIRRQFLWSHAAERSLDLYKWLLGRRPRPAFVFG
jgi:glycosyltransferase involved in cell wall biosynthesis